MVVWGAPVVVKADGLAAGPDAGGACCLPADFEHSVGCGGQRAFAGNGEEMVPAVVPQLYVDCAASRLTLRPRFKITAAILSKLQSQKIPSAVLTQLETLQDQEFADEDAFLSALAGAIGSEAVS